MSPSPSAFDQSQAMLARLRGQRHLETGQFHGGREVVPPVVMSELAVYLYAVRAGLAVMDELLSGGPKVLGPRWDAVAHGK